MGYDSTARRRLRVVRRVVRSSIDPRSYPSVGVVPAYWWDGHANFGDALTPWLLRSRGVLPVLVSSDRAGMVGVGSILEHLPESFDGVVWGSGLIHDRPLRLPRARFLAVRGQLTKERLGLSGDVALGDAGILAATVVPRPETRWDLGFVPHSDHHHDPIAHELVRRHPGQVRFIDVRRSPDHVVREIAACSAVLTTSLHGLIVADAYGIPAAWATLAPDLIGGTFKFDDYESAVTPGRSRRIALERATSASSVIARTRLADPGRVAEGLERLGAAVQEIPVVRDLPFLAMRHR
jgi:hypothetical protein